MNNKIVLRRLIHVYERMRDQQEFICDLTLLMTPLLKSISESCPGFVASYAKNSAAMQPQVIQAKRDVLAAIERQIEILKAEFDET